jgi:hypothetical protein
MRGAILGVMLAVLAAPVHSQQVPEIAAARVAAHADSAPPVDHRSALRDVATGAVIGAGMWIVLAKVFYTGFRGVCESLNELGADCSRPNYVKLGLLGAASGAIAGAIVATRRAEKAQHASVRITALTQVDGVGLQFVFR